MSTKQASRKSAALGRLPVAVLRCLSLPKNRETLLANLLGMAPMFALASRVDFDEWLKGSSGILLAIIAVVASRILTDREKSLALRLLGLDSEPVASPPATDRAAASEINAAFGNGFKEGYRAGIRTARTDSTPPAKPNE